MAPANSLHANKEYPQIAIPGLGAVKGILDRKRPVAKFLNIPFGVVHERWRPATKQGPWEGVRDATKNGCNIYMPASAVSSGEELPVLVWIYGGGLKIGGISNPLYDCSELVVASLEVNKPMVLVTINYRINYFGFLSSKELVLDAQERTNKIPEEQRRWYDASVGNWGFIDQILGLEWIREHIRAFSGDAKRVTLMGESAGATSISYLQLIPECRGLFHRSIIQSGAAATLPTMRPEYEGQRYFDHLCKTFNISADISPLEKVAKLRSIPEKQLAESLNGSPVLFFGPTLDDVLFKEDSRLSAGDASLYDPELNWVVAGTCADEGTMFTNLFNAVTVNNFAKLKARLCAPGDSEVFDRLFRIPRRDADTLLISDRILNDGLFKYPLLQISEAIFAHPTCHLTRYHMDVQVEALNSIEPRLKAMHGTEAFFTFGNDFSIVLLSDEERAFIRKVQQVWIEVVTAESPEKSNLPKVSHADSVNPSGNKAVVEEALVFGVDLKVKNGVVERMSAEEIAFWNRSSAYAAEQSKLGRGAEVGFDIFRSV
ncbi:hypothetical protein BGX28_005900 [Mortierella sp. GBA30]|nr:hypothetical protein BGX28_005900 [Mortierella sp. GBA30]